MSAFDDFWGKLAEAIGGLAVGALKKYKDQVQKDGLSFAEKIKTDLQLWSQQLSDGKIDRDDLEFLMKGKKDLAELLALKQEALGKVALDQFINDLINVVISTISKFFPKV